MGRGEGTRESGILAPEGESTDGQDQSFKMVQKWDKANKELGKRKSFSLGFWCFFLTKVYWDGSS